MKHFQDDPNPPPFIKALAEVRQLATREGYCYQHIQAIAVAIDQYAAKAFGNRDYFLNKPYSIGGERNGLALTEHKPAHDSEKGYDGNCCKQ